MRSPVIGSIRGAGKVPPAMSAEAPWAKTEEEGGKGGATAEEVKLFPPMCEPEATPPLPPPRSKFADDGGNL